MTKISFRFFLLALLPALAASAVRASTYGDNLLGIGAASRALGGTGVAAPSDVIGALAANPATLGFLPPSERTAVEFSTTVFVPHVSARVGAVSADPNPKTARARSVRMRKCPTLVANPGGRPV